MRKAPINFQKKQATQKCNIRHKYYRVHSANTTITTTKWKRRGWQQELYTWILRVCNVPSLMFEMISAWQKQFIDMVVYIIRAYLQFCNTTPSHLQCVYKCMYIKCLLYVFKNTNILSNSTKVFALCHIFIICKKCALNVD